MSYDYDPERNRIAAGVREALNGFAEDCLPSAPERRRYAVLQAAAVMFAGRNGFVGPTECVRIALLMLEDIEMKEKG